MRPALPRLVWFTVAGEPDGFGPHFAIRRADRQYWAANAYRGYRLCGLACRRFPPQLVGSHGRRIPVQIIPAPEVHRAA